MSDQALKDAKIENLQAENAQYQTIVRNMSTQNRATKQLCDELLNANVQLRASLLMLEEDVKRFRQENAMFTERCADLQKKLDELEDLAKAA